MRMNTKQTSKWWIDASLLGSFLLAYFLDLTGLELHQWLGVAVGALALYHLITHWTWVLTVTQRFIGKTSGRSRLYYFSDFVILVGFFLIGFSGLVLSTWFDLPLANYDEWRQVHIYASILTLVLVVVKIALHGRWVVTTAKKIFAAPAAPPVRTSTPPPHLTPQRQAPAPARASQQMTRRDFIKMMGLVGAASAVALSSAASSLRQAEAAAGSASQLNSGSSSTSKVSTGQASTVQSSTVQATSTPQPAATVIVQEQVSAPSSGSACQAQCGRHCAFPGQCRKYRDANGNGLCDLGECV